MNKKDFNNLVASIEQINPIRANKLKLGQVSKFNQLQIKWIRKNYINFQDNLHIDRG